MSEQENWVCNSESLKHRMHDIRCIADLDNTESVNALLDKGWRLLILYQADNRIHFVMAFYQ